jgi:head-tail adaptor
MTSTRSAVAAGKRDRRIALVPLVDTTDTSGFPLAEDGTPTITLWVSKEDISGRERLLMDQESAPYDSRFVLPFADAYNPNTVDVAKVFALEYAGRRYDIVNASEIGRRDGVEMLTLARQG